MAPGQAIEKIAHRAFSMIFSGSQHLRVSEFKKSDIILIFSNRFSLEFRLRARGLMAVLPGKLPSSSDFESEVEGTFRAQMADGKDFEMSLVKLDVHASDEFQENFSLTFCAPPDTTAGQNTYRLENSRLGAMDLFLVPVRKDDEGLYFEAVFNCLRGK
jgi:hypothetical protein